MIEVSVILPVYNSFSTIEQTLNSIIDQKFSKKYEIIVINDGSTDKTNEILEKFKRKYINIINVINKKNSGVSDSRNIGLKMSRGKFVTFIDSDDLYEENFLQKLYDKINNGFDLVSCSYKNFEANNEIHNLEKNEKFFSINNYIEKTQSNYLFNQIWNKIYKIEIIKEKNIKFDINKSIAEDWEFNLKYIKECKNIYHINECLYDYRISSNGLGFRYRKDSYKIKFELLNLTDKIYDELNIVDDYIDKCYIKQTFSFLSSIMDKRNNITFKEKINNIRNFFESNDFMERMSKITIHDIKYKIMLYFIKLKNPYILSILGIIANLYDCKDKKKKFGIDGG